MALLATVYSSEVSEGVLSEKDACLTVQPLLLECLEDYTTDKRGDVGSLCASLCHMHSPCPTMAINDCFCVQCKGGRNEGACGRLQADGRTSRTATRPILKHAYGVRHKVPEASCGAHCTHSRNCNFMHPGHAGLPGRRPHVMCLQTSHATHEAAIHSCLACCRKRLVLAAYMHQSAYSWFCKH